MEIKKHKSYFQGQLLTTLIKGARERYYFTRNKRSLISFSTRIIFKPNEPIVTD